MFKNPNRKARARLDFRKLTLWQKIILLFFGGEIFVAEEKREGWSGFHKIYLTKCKRGHGLFEGHRQGFGGVIECPECLELQVNSKHKI
jgi:hypothetical protein